MKMENQEEILLLLERFTKSKQKDIPRELEDYLNFVARTGDTLYGWVLVKPLFREKLVNVITDFHDNTPSIADLPQCPNVDPFNYERMKLALLDRLDSFSSAPFTVQRICELLTEPRKQYTRVDKFMRAVEKNILVVSTQEPGRRRSESENGDSLDSIVNGDLEVNVDIEMDNEQFHLEADALLPDSSEPVGSMHNSLSDVDVPAAEREGEAASEVNSNRVSGGGVFLSNENNQFDRSSPEVAAKDGLNVEKDDNWAVVDTNENATDGDIGPTQPTLEGIDHPAGGETKDDGKSTEKVEVADKFATETEASAVAVATEKLNDEAEGKEELDNSKAMKPEAPFAEIDAESNDQPSTAQAASSEGVEEVEKKSRSKPTTEPSGPSSSDEEEQTPFSAQTTLADDDGEPHAKMTKYNVAATTQPIISSDSADSSSGSDLEARSADASSSSFSSSSSTSEGKQLVEEKPLEVNSNAPEPTEGVAEPHIAPAVVDSSSSLEAVVAPAEEKVTTIEEEERKTLVAKEDSADASPQQQPPHSKDEQDQPTTTTTTTLTAAPDGGLKSDGGETAESSSNIVETESKQEELAHAVPSALVSATNPLEMESACINEAQVTSSSSSPAAVHMELAAGSVTAAVSAEAVMDAEEMTGEMVNEVGSNMEATNKGAEDNVMDIDESSVEPMDQ